MLKKNDLTCGLVKTFLYYHSFEAWIKVFRLSIAENESHNIGESKNLDQKHHDSVKSRPQITLAMG